MGLTYLNDKNWSDITREERFFCAELYSAIKDNEAEFVKWLITLDTMSKVPLNADQEWEIGFEVSFYRDLLHDKDEKVKNEDCKEARKFDFCLFSEDQIVIIEAKAQGQFKPKQYEKFEQDKACVTESIELARGRKSDVKVYIIALATTEYFGNVPVYGKERRVPAVFDGHFSWKDLSGSSFRRDSFLRANKIYKK